jgi:hypothetical protein
MAVLATGTVPGIVGATGIAPDATRENNQTIKQSYSLKKTGYLLVNILLITNLI